MTDKTPRAWDGALEQEFYTPEEIAASDARVGEAQLEIDREWIIEGLEFTLQESGWDANVAYDQEMMIQVVTKAIALLKAQTARVMTLSEMNEKRGRGEAVYYEDRDATYKSQDVFVVVLDKDLDVVWLKAETYTLAAKMSTMGKTWRCWTRMPTRAQREAEA